MWILTGGKRLMLNILFSGNFVRNSALLASVVLFVTFLFQRNIILEQQSEIVKLEVSLKNATSSIEQLQHLSEINKTQINDFNSLLQRCYEASSSLTEDMLAIEKNMENTGTVTSLHDNTKTGDTYDQITKEQNTKGINFINSLF